MGERHGPTSRLAATPFSSQQARVCLGALLAAGLGSLACRSASEAGASAADVDTRRTADIFFTTGLSGTVEPCGCTSEPLGGLGRLAAVVGPPSSARALLDAGQLLLPDEPIEAMTRPQHLEKAALLARVYRKLGVAGVNLSPPDLAEGAELLVELQKEGAVPFVSANLRPRVGGGPMVARSFLRKVGGIRIGVTGVAVPEDAARVSDGVVALEIGPALAAEVGALRDDGAELVVVLAHLPAAEAEALAEIEGIDVVLRAPGSAIEHTPAEAYRSGGALIAEAGRQGQYVGKLTLHLDGKRGEGPLAWYDGGASARAEQERLQRRAEAMEAEAERMADRPEVATARRRMAAKLRTRAEGLGTSAEPPRGSYLEMKLIALGQERPSDSEVGRMLTAYDQRLRELNAERVDEGACEAPEDAPRFVGNEACGACHEAAMEVWKTTKHALAWETLEAKEKHYDFTCVGCHTVGFRAPGGFCSLADAAPFEDVGCESCHGPGSLHLARQDPSSIRRGDDEAVCKQCHVVEHSDQFDFATYRPRIMGPGHGAPEAASDATAP